jgi:hypothetical protein
VAAPDVAQATGLLRTDRRPTRTLSLIGVSTPEDPEGEEEEKKRWLGALFIPALSGLGVYVHADSSRAS